MLAEQDKWCISENYVLLLKLENPHNSGLVIKSPGGGLLLVW